MLRDFYRMPVSGLKETALEYAFAITAAILSLAIVIGMIWLIPEIMIPLLWSFGAIGSIALILNIAWFCSYKFLQYRDRSR